MWLLLHAGTWLVYSCERTSASPTAHGLRNLAGAGRRGDHRRAMRALAALSSGDGGPCTGLHCPLSPGSDRDSTHTTRGTGSSARCTARPTRVAGRIVRHPLGGCTRDTCPTSSATKRDQRRSIAIPEQRGPGWSIEEHAFALLLPWDYRPPWSTWYTPYTSSPRKNRMTNTPARFTTRILRRPLGEVLKPSSLSCLCNILVS